MPIYANKPVSQKRRHILYNMDRKSAPDRGYDATWSRFRNNYVKEHPLCATCLQNNLYIPMAELHHIKPLIDYPLLRLERSNVISLCKRCHAKATALEQQNRKQ